ncbi:MAG: hypothetical protein ACOCSE_01035 [Chitinivibrionales bacterium]
MTVKHHRKPVRNFFVIYPFQIRILIVISLIVFMAISLTLISLYFSFQYIVSSGDIYFLASDSGKRLPILNITGIISFGIGLTIFISLIISIIAGLISSRKAAVPIYKMEKWIEAVEEGHLRARMHFREKNTEISELAHRCNNFSHKISDIYVKLRESSEKMTPEEMSESNRERLHEIKETIQRFKRKEHL